MKRVLSSFLLLATLALPSWAGAATWDVDPSHTTAGFTVKHMLISNVRGKFQAVSGTVDYDPAKPEATRINVSIDTASIDTENAKRDEHLRSGDFFDAAKHPKLTFVSKQVKSLGDGRFEVVGDLTMRGATRVVTLNVDGFGTQVKDPYGFTRIGGSATTKVNRKDFGISWNKSLDAGGAVVGDEVTIHLDIELTAKL